MFIEDWTQYEDNVGIALLRWIYTDDINVADSANDNVIFGLLIASYQLKLSTLFETCEKSLVSSVNGNTCSEWIAIAKKVGADNLVKKCLQLGSKLPYDSSPLKLQAIIDVKPDENGCSSSDCVSKTMIVRLI